MKTNPKKLLLTGAVLLLLFAVWTLLIKTVDVAPVGQNGTDIGFSSVNVWFHGLTGVRMAIYTVTDWLGFVPLAVCVFFAAIGLVQLIKRKSLKKVDRDIIVLGVYYIAVILGYLLFEKVHINYRPVLIDGRLEPSYPSSTTLLVLSVMPTLIFEANRRLKNKAAATTVSVVAALFSAGMVVGRLISGVHWLTDIVGGILLSAALYLFFRGAVGTSDLKKKNGAEDVVIRPETEEDRRAVEELVRESFWNVYRPGCLEHYVLHKLRDDPAFVKELDFVMEKDGKIIGQNIFMRATIKSDGGEDIPIMTMGPICIAPEYKRQGYGKKLLDFSLEKAAAIGCPAVCFEGNIDFYGKSGFTCAREFGIRYHGLPEGADDSFFLCRELTPGYLDGVSGEYAPPGGYFVAERDPEGFAEFDATFPEKEKLVLPGQLFR